MIELRRKRLIYNLVSSLGNQFVTILCAFILPKLILSTYGSEVNGLISSISQFLMIISFSEFGVTAVVQSALYKPLANGDMLNVSRVISSANKFYRRISLALSVYIVLLCTTYPFFVKTNFDFWYIIAMILVLGINSLAQYLLGITNSQLLNADQKGYVVSLTSIVVNIFNTVACSLLILFGCTIHIVKLATALIFAIKPLVYIIYVRKNYHIDRRAKYQTEPISQKWNGFAQHVAYFVMNSTDVLVLTALSTLHNVSIYAVYHLVLNGVNQLLSIVETSVKPLMGEFWAKGYIKKFKDSFSAYEWIMHTVSCIIYGCVIVLIVPFVLVYTFSVNDANYNAPAFAVILSLSFALHYIKSPYNTIIMAVGHYKQTQHSYIIAALINISLSVILVYKFGLIGVAIGTFAARLYQVFWQSWYIYKNILNNNYSGFLKKFAVDIASLCLGYLLTSTLKMTDYTYLSWLFLAVKTFIIWVLIVGVINYIFSRHQMTNSIKLLLKIKK